MERYTDCKNCFCSGLSPEARRLICENAHRIHYKQRNEQVMFLDSRHVLIMESGYALISRGFMTDKQQGTDILEPGSVVGIVQLFQPDYTATLNFLPLTPVSGCMVRLSLMEKLAAENAEIATALLKEFSARYGRVVSKLAIHSYGTANQRLQFSIARVRELGLEKEITHEDLACLSGLSRVTVTKLLNS